MGFLVFLLIILLGMLCAAGLAIGGLATLMVVWSAIKLVFSRRNLTFFARWFIIWALGPMLLHRFTDSDSALRAYVGLALLYTLYKLMDGALSLFRRDKQRERERAREEIRQAIHEELVTQKFKTVPRHSRRRHV